MADRTTQRQKAPKAGAKAPAERPQRPLEGTKKRGGPPSSHPATELSDNVHIESAVFNQILTWMLPLAKTADSDRGFHLAHFTGTHLRFTDGAAGIAIPFQGLKDVAVDGAKLFQIGKAMSTHKDDADSVVLLTAEENKLVYQHGTYIVTLSRASVSHIPGWPSDEPTWYDVTDHHLTAIKNVTFAVSKNPNSLISLQTVALRKGVAMAGVENRFVLQNSGFPTAVNSMLMDRLLMLLNRADAEPVKFGFAPNRAWVEYPDGTQLWGAVPTIPWPISVDENIKAFVAKTKDVLPDVTWEPDAVVPTLSRVMALGEKIILIKVVKGEHSVDFEAVAYNTESFETAGTTKPNLKSYEIMVDGVMLKDIMHVTNRWWFFPEDSTMVFLGPQGLFSIMGIMRK